MNNRYDIKIPCFSKLTTNDVVVTICDDKDKPSFKVLVYPHEGGGTEKHVTVHVRRYTHYSHRVPGLIENSLSFTVSIVDVEGRDRFFRSFGIENFFNWDWVASATLENESAHERLLSRKFLFDQFDEFLENDVLTVRVDVSYQISPPSFDQFHAVKCATVVNASDIERLECIGLMEESFNELRQYSFLYQDLLDLHELLGSDPDYESLEVVTEEDFDKEKLKRLFKDMSDCFKFHRSLQKQATGIVPYTENLDEDKVKKIQKKLWRNRVSFHKDNILALEKALLNIYDGLINMKIDLDREKEWTRRLELVEPRMLMILRLFDLPIRLKEGLLDRLTSNQSEESFYRTDERLEENLREMIFQYESLKKVTVNSEYILKTKINFLNFFLDTIEILSDLVFNISNTFFDWTQSLIVRNLPLAVKESKPTIDGNAPEQEGDKGELDRDSGSIATEIIIETETSEIVVPFVSKLLDCSTVFKRMLSHPFKEAIEGKLIIKHFDPMTVKDLLYFVDSGGHLREDMDREESLSLYFMAHMYQVERLEQKLADHLYSVLCTQSVGFVRKYSNKLGEEHPLGKVVKKFYEDMQALDKSGDGLHLDNEPEFKNGLKVWAREQRMMYEAESNLNFYQ